VGLKNKNKDMENRLTINLFVDKRGKVSRRNFTIQADSYDKKTIELEVSKKLELNENKWTIETSEELEYVEKERVIFWKAKLKESK
jgi:hypothetical protein